MRTILLAHLAQCKIKVSCVKLKLNICVTFDYYLIPQRCFLHLSYSRIKAVSYVHSFNSGY